MCDILELHTRTHRYKTTDTCADVHRALVKRLEDFVRKEVDEDRDEKRSDDDNDDKKSEYPFKIQIVNIAKPHQSKRESRKFPPTGTILESNNALPRLRNEMFAVDWIDRSLYKDCKVVKDSSVDESGSADSSNDDNTLKHCLTAFAAPEMIGSHDDPIWRCEKCKCKQAASKRMEIWRLSDILVLHIKRFQYTMYAREKLSTLVDFPVCLCVCVCVFLVRKIIPNTQHTHRYVPWT